MLNLRQEVEKGNNQRSNGRCSPCCQPQIQQSYSLAKKERDLRWYRPPSKTSLPSFACVRQQVGTSTTEIWLREKMVFVDKINLIKMFCSALADWVAQCWEGRPEE